MEHGKAGQEVCGTGELYFRFEGSNTWKIFGNTFWYIVILLVFNFVMPYILSFILSCVIKRDRVFTRRSFPAECDFAGRRLDSVYMDSESDFGSGRDCGRLVWAETAVLVENGGLGHRGTVHYHDLEDVWLQFHQHSGGRLRCLNGGHRGGASGNVPMWKIFGDIVVPMSSATGIYVFITTIVQGLQYVFTPIKVVTQEDRTMPART